MKMVKCSNCGAEVPVDASFCEACGAKITPAAAPPPPPSAYPTPPPAAAPPAEKAGPPMKIIAIAVIVIVIVLGGVLFLASSATSGLKLELQSGIVTTSYPLPGDLTMTLTLIIENPGFMGVEIVGNHLRIKCRSSGDEAVFWSGYVPELRGTYSGTTTKTITIKLPWGTWANDASIVNVWWDGCFFERPMQMSIEGTLDTKCLFMTGTSTVTVLWKSVTGY